MRTSEALFQIARRRLVLSVACTKCTECSANAPDDRRPDRVDAR